MDCKQAQTNLCELSAQACDEITAREVERHLAQCPPCEEEWRELQRSLLQLSTATQSLPSSEQSRAMWAACEKKLAAASRAAASRPAPSLSLAERLQQALGLQPRLGWVALGGACALLFGALLTSPSPSVAPLENNASEYSRVVQSSIRDEAPIQRASSNTQKPPRAAALFIDHHTAMGFDPFTDHVGPTLVSFSASAPAER